MMHDLIGKPAPICPGHARHLTLSTLTGGEAFFSLGNGLGLSNMQPLPLHAQAVEAVLGDGAVVEGVGREGAVRRAVNQFRLHDSDARIGERGAVVGSAAAQATALVLVKIAAALESDACG